MTSKYFLWTSSLIISILLFSSCLNSQNSDIEYSTDAQIYTFSMSSSTDSTGALSSTKFTIDQLTGKIFNQDSLPYLFHVDSVKLTASGFNSYAFSQITLHLQNNDSSYAWNGSDSVAVSRLKQIVTTAQDGNTKKTYDFQLNIYQQDPYILTWNKINDNYLTPPVGEQKTIPVANKFITYYTSGASLKAAASSTADGTEWTAVDVLGLPPSVHLPSMIVANNAGYVLDTENTLYKTTDGVNWSPVATSLPVTAIYGELPSATRGATLAVVNDEGTLKFAETDDFETFQIMNDVPAGTPVKNVSVTNVDNPAIYSAKYIILSGGLKADNTQNEAIWIIQEKDNQITTISRTAPVSLQGSSIFSYDDKLYLMTGASEENSFMLSENYGLNWVAAEDNQAFPTDFAYRSNASVIVDANNFIWIFGGISKTQTQVVDVWRARLNKLAGDN